MSQVSKQRDLMACILLSLLCGFAVDAGAATLTVLSAADSGPFTLRQAIIAANGTAGADIIEFNIAGVGVKTITPLTPLPTITQPLTIDGYSQPGASANILDDASNATILIQIDGVSAGATASGLAVCAPASAVRGLSITRFQQRGIAFGIDSAAVSCATGAADGSTARGNFIGLAPNGSPAGNGIGVAANNSSVDIGGSTAADRNVIGSQNAGAIGLVNSGASASTVLGNLIGYDPSGLQPRPNTGSAISVANNISVVTIGSPAAPNRIANSTAGITIGNGVSGVSAFANHIGANSGLGMDLCAGAICPDGVTPNDLNDVDTGGNDLQNFPVLGTLGRVAGGISVQGSLDVGNVVSRPFTIAVYANQGCDGSGNGEGERFLGSAVVNLSSPSAETFSFTLTTSAALPVGTVITATATDNTGNTSEFSLCKALDTPSNFVVTKTADTNDGVCDADCSLREAIVAANAATGADRISFNIPGAGVHSISITTALPSITGPVTIDGYTQPGAAVNTAAVGSNAVILIEVMSAGTQLAFDINANDVSVRGLSLTALNFPVRIGGTTAANNALIAGNFFGLRANGAVSGNAAGVELDRGLNAVIGGTSLADRNVISASGAAFTVAANIDLRGISNSSARIQGNFIGTDLAGASLSGSGQKNGVLARGLISSALIGGTAPAQFNRFGGNTAAIAVTGTATGIRVAGNEIGGSSGLGIDLAATGNIGDGVTPNDLNDADSGANNLQNFPVLTSFSANAGQLQISGSLDVPTATSNSDYIIGVYANASCDASGNGEGELYLGSATVKLSGNSTVNEAFQFAIPAAPVANGAISVTATDPLGNTSEFSACLLDTLLRNGFE
jgi:trimeric autotransporter adhesin